MAQDLARTIVDIAAQQLAFHHDSHPTLEITFTCIRTNLFPQPDHEDDHEQYTTYTFKRMVNSQNEEAFEVHIKERWEYEGPGILSNDKEMTIRVKDLDAVRNMIVAWYAHQCSSTIVTHRFMRVYMQSSAAGDMGADFSHVKAEAMEGLVDSYIAMFKAVA